MASNDRGDAVALWRDSRGIQVAVSRRGGAFGPARTVPRSRGGLAADVDLNEDGRALIWWRAGDTTCCVRAYIVGLKVDGGFGRTRAVTPRTDYLTFDAAIGRDGRFFFTYTTGQRFRPRYARVAPPSGRLGRRITIATGEVTPRQLWYVGKRPYLAYTRASDDHRKLFERRVGWAPRAWSRQPSRGGPAS